MLPVGEHELNWLKGFYDKHRNNPFVRKRCQRNVNAKDTDISFQKVWEAVCSAQLTSQQKSGPGSAVYRYINGRADLFDVSQMRRAYDAGELTEEFIASHLSDFGGIRFSSRLGRSLFRSFSVLRDDDFWCGLSSHLKSLSGSNGLSSSERLGNERKASNCMSELNGLGPKQSRNALQMLGLSHYVVPLDSRIAKFFSNSPIDLEIDPGKLSSVKYYIEIEDVIIRFSSEIGVLPCLLDAAIFSSFDGDQWESAGATRW